MIMHNMVVEDEEGDVKSNSNFLAIININLFGAILNVNFVVI